MPFVLSPGAVAAESLVFDGLDLAQGPSGAIQLDAFTPPFAKKRLEWVEASDSDGALLARDPLVSNGQATIKLAIAAVTRDDAQTTIATIVDKIEEADRNPLGIPLVWTPSGSTPTLTFYVLTGEVTDLPVDWESGYMAFQPSVTITLECRPYGYGVPYTVSGSATAGPLVTLDLPNVKGDVPAEARLIITESSSQSRRTVEWGAEYLHYNPASPWSLVLDSDSLVTTGFAGTQTTLAGAYDPNATGNSIISTLVYTGVQAVCGTGVQPHVGTFRVKARINTGPSGCIALSARFAWRTGDGSYTTNDPVTITDTVQEYLEIDLGLITVPEALLGTQSWDGRVEMWSGNPGDQIYVDYLLLFPVEGYGKATASYAYSPGVIVATDTFAGLGSGVALNARTPDVGAAWATSGVATDFVGSTATETTTTLPRVSRSTALVEAEARAAVLGSAMTNQEVQATTYRSSAANDGRLGLIARYIDDDNYFRLYVELISGAAPVLTFAKKIAGAETVIGSTTVSATIGSNHALYLRAVVFVTGRAIGTLTFASGTWQVEAVDSVLATAGTLASGKGGIADQSRNTQPGFRKYDDVVISTPAAEPIALYSGRKLEIRSDDTVRESSAGGAWGHPASYRGSRFKVNPAGTDNRTTRVVCKASRNDLSSAEDANLTDQIKLEATITPRYSATPRS